ncbi:Spy/CpxP family protein refolding chaperone [Algoriphagus marinus]|uniref:Spy/CpxP family protein refolding chaperone n=1 Tax=Algoriphagus marinus TaxID=1925762 RepID=UPI00094B97C1|nr:hypothetical protein [Algoriphagus marinus]
MKKYALTLSILLISFGFGLAQRPTERYDPEKLQAARIAFITTRLDLTPDQAEKFWPVFNQYSDTRDALLKEMSSLNDRRDGPITESEAKKRVEKRFEIQKKLLSTEEKFVTDISKAVSYNQILMLNGLTRDFTRQLYQRQRKEN